RDGLSRAFAVRVNRAPMARVGGGPFGVGPTVVGPCRSLVDFLPARAPDIVDEDPAGPWFDGKPKWVSEAIGPYGAVLAHDSWTIGSREEGVVLGNGSVRADPKELPLEGIEPLRRRPRGLLPDPEVKAAIEPEVNATALMAGGNGTPELRLVVSFQENDL